MKISKIIKSLRAVGSTTTKRGILEQHKDNEALRLLFYATYDGSVNFWIKADKDMTDNNWRGTGVITLSFIQNLLDKLNGRQITGNAARDFLKSEIESLELDEAKVIIGMINRDLDCKVSTSIANGVWGELIRDFPVMLADKFNKKNAAAFYEAETPNGGASNLIVQLKADGGRAEAVVGEDGVVRMYSRAGNELLVHGVFDFLSQFAGYVVDGEIVSVDPITGVFLDRKTSNGIYNKCVRNTISPAEAACMHYVVWDLIPIRDFFAGESKIPYSDRFKKLQMGYINIQESKTGGNHLSIIESKRINTILEATEFYDMMLAKKEEGAMLKLANAGWENRRSRSVLKLKQELDATLLCVETTPHSKNPDWIGSLTCVSACDEIEVSVGSGLTEEDRLKDPSEFIGSLIAIKYNALIKSKKAVKHSMFLPIFQNIRTDVTAADTLENLK